MGFHIHKSIKMPGGFRLNLSTRGVGASWGVKGFRVGMGPSGSHVSAYIPGTGIGWSSSLGSLAHPGVRSSGGRDAQRARTELEARGRESAKMQEHEQAAHDVALFDNQLSLLTSVHKETWNPWNWTLVANGPPPSGMDPARWDWLRRIAQGILARDLGAFQAVVTYLSPFSQLSEIGQQIEATVVDPEVAIVRFVVHPPQIVPMDTLSLTPTGKLSRKTMPVTRSWTIYQDHVCSAVFRLAREMFALVPVDVTLVHAARMIVDPGTGNAVRQTIVSAAFTREGVSAVDFQNIDASQALERFPHAMELKARDGFDPVDEIELEDLMQADDGGH